jgi:hypothetical protein
MPTTNHATTPLQLQRLLGRRQQIANEATAALAHGSRKAHRLYALLAELEDQLERDHPRVVAELLGDWATQEADELATHQEGTATACEHCQSARAQTALPAPRARIA